MARVLALFCPALTALAALLALTPRPAASTRDRIAVLGALTPATNPALASEAIQTLSASGWQPVEVHPEDLADPDRFSAASCDILVLPHADTLPAAAQENVLAFLQEGGRLLCLEGPPFAHYVHRTAAGWKTREEALSSLTPAAPLVDLARADVPRWERGSSTPAHPASITVEPGPHGPSLRLSFPQFEGWDHFAPPHFERSPYPAGAGLTAFWAKGDRQTDALVVEWRERDGSRWIASVPLTTSWRRYTLTPADFRYWEDNPARNRGGTGDHFRPENAQRLAIGLAQSHAAMRPGPKTLWVAGLDAARLPPGIVEVEPPVLESLSPWYKVAGDGPGGRARVGGRWEPILRYVGGTAAPAPGRLEVLASRGGRPTAWVYRPRTGPYARSAWGACTGLAGLARVAEALARPCCLTAAGSTPFYRSGQPVRFWATLSNRGPSDEPVAVRARWRLIGPPGGERRRSDGSSSTRVVVKPGPEVQTQIAASALPPGDYRYSIDALDHRGASIGEVAGRFTVLNAERRPGPFVQVTSGEFVLDGKPWRPVGVNYWPSWVSGQDRDEYWASWLSPNQYDAAAVEADLQLAQAMCVNVVSIQYQRTEDAPALQDFLERCRNHGIRANVFLAGGSPLGSAQAQMQGLIRAASLARNDAVFAYDVAWEPHVGGHVERRGLDALWMDWIVQQYGSVTKAERDWGFPVPHEQGQATNPPDAQLTQDGPWRRMVAAYRRFVDTRISAGYWADRRAIRQVDPRHLVGVRSGYGGNGSLNVEGVMAFDLCAGAQHLDFVSPEGYSLSGDQRSVTAGGGFTTAYARWAGNGKPVFWAEFGQSVYPQTSASKLDAQGAYHELIYRMVLDSGANGSACWWWPGGLRIDENSDFGITDPDGGSRPAAQKLREYALRISRMPLPPTGRAVPLTIDRDADARGYAAVWLRGRDAWGQAHTQGLVPILRTEGTGTTTANVPLVAVGNVPADGRNPLKYVDAELWVSPPSASSRRLAVTVTNSGEARWLSSGPGRVVLLVKVGERVVEQVRLAHDVPRHAQIETQVKDPGLPAHGSITLRMAILERAGRMWEFGCPAVFSTSGLGTR